MIVSFLCYNYYGDIMNENILIYKQNNEGNGICKIDNIVTFVPYTLPNELIKLEIIKHNKNYNDAKLLDIIKPSIERQEVMCPYYYRCGGCNLMHQIYQYQLDFKKDKVINNLKKISNIEVNNIDIISDIEYNYRNHIILHVENDNIGFYSHNTNNIVNIDKCYIVNDKINNIITGFKSFINTYKNHNINEIDIRSYDSTMVIIKSDKFNYKNELIKYINSDSIYINNDLVYGNKYGIISLDKYKYNISPNSFFQKNTNIANIMFKYIKSLLNTNSNVLDLYCGIGAISIYISDICNIVYGIEIIDDAIVDANINKEINNINNIEFICNDVENIINNYKNIDTIIVDPPRTGLSKKSLENIIDINSKNIIYVSCNSTTLSRDLNILKDKYTFKSIKLFDMFPNTDHVESVVLMSRRDK